MYKKRLLKNFIILSILFSISCGDINRFDNSETIESVKVVEILIDTLKERNSNYTLVKEEIENKRKIELIEHFRTLPESFQKLINLEHLTINSIPYSRLEFKIPSWITVFKKLKTIEIIADEIILPENIYKLNSLLGLSLVSKGYIKLPESFVYLNSLQSFYVNTNVLECNFFYYKGNYISLYDIKINYKNLKNKITEFVMVKALSQSKKGGRLNYVIPYFRIKTLKELYLGGDARFNKVLKLMKEKLPQCKVEDIEEQF